MIPLEFECQRCGETIKARIEGFRVIDKHTGKEADTYEIALHEEWAQRLCYCDMQGWALEDDGTLLLLDECGNFEYADRDRFDVVLNMAVQIALRKREAKQDGES